MALIINSNQANQEFTPAAGQFIVDVVGSAELLSKGAAGAATFVSVGVVSGRAVVDNPVAGAVYKWAGAPISIRADQ